MTADKLMAGVVGLILLVLLWEVIQAMRAERRVILEQDTRRARHQERAAQAELRPPREIVVMSDDGMDPNWREYALREFRLTGNWPA